MERSAERRAWRTGANTLGFVPFERLLPAPDCGMKYLPLDRALAKLNAPFEGDAIVRRELGTG